MQRLRVFKLDTFFTFYNVLCLIKSFFSYVHLKSRRLTDTSAIVKNYANTETMQSIISSGFGIWHHDMFSRDTPKASATTIFKCCRHNALKRVTQAMFDWAMQQRSEQIHQRRSPDGDTRTCGAIVAVARYPFIASSTDLCYTELPLKKKAI